MNEKMVAGLTSPKTRPDHVVATGIIRPKIPICPSLSKFSYAECSEWNGIFQHAGPISSYSRLGTFLANIDNIDSTSAEE